MASLPENPPGKRTVIGNHPLMVQIHLEAVNNLLAGAKPRVEYKQWLFPENQKSLRTIIFPTHIGAGAGDGI